MANSQLEKGVRDLQHQDMRVIMLMTNQDALTRPPHAMLLIMFLQALQTRQHRGVFFWLSLLRAEGVVGERVQSDSLGLVGIEGVGKGGGVGGLEGGGCYRRHCGRSKVLRDLEVVWLGSCRCVAEDDVEI